MGKNNVPVQNTPAFVSREGPRQTFDSFTLFTMEKLICDFCLRLPYCHEATLPSTRLAPKLIVVADDLIILA